MAPAMATSSSSSLQPRAFDSYLDPPPPQDAVYNNPTLLLSWWCTLFSMTIILVRLSGRWIRTERLFREDWIMALSIIPLMIRMGCAHIVLRYGTNNTTIDGLSLDDISQREIGSKAVLAARIFYALFLWIAKLTILEFLQRNFSGMWKRSWTIALNGCRWFLAVTFVGVVLATLLECHPIQNYWQVTPDPGPHCRQGWAQLMTMGVTDSITDLVLVAFPVAVIYLSNLPLKKKLSSMFLFALSIFLVGITIYRMYAVVMSHANQQLRSLIASLEILAATAVSNALVLGSFVRDKGAKKAKFKFGSISGESNLDRPTTARTRQQTRAALSWGSDVDLVSDVGYRLGPEFKDTKSPIARPAPAAFRKESIENKSTLVDTTVYEAESGSSSSDLKSPEAPPVAPAIELHRESPLTPQKMSFFDVGGLLGDAPPARRPSETSVQLPEDFALSPQIRNPGKSTKAQRGFFSDMGTILDTEHDRRPRSFLGVSQTASRNPSTSRPSRNPSVSRGSRAPSVSRGSRAPSVSRPILSPTAPTEE